MSKVLRKELLPIGSVVILKEGSKAVMIYGRKQQILNENDDGKTFDYTACFYPEGYLMHSQSYFFNHDKIDKILHMGYINEDEKYLKIQLLG